MQKGKEKESKEKEGKEKARYFTVKTSLQYIGWNEKYKDALESLVCETHSLTVHTYQLACWIFVHELEVDPRFDLNRCVNNIFFEEVFLHLTNRVARPTTIAARNHAREIIQRHLDNYL
ncbi:hypothetical protein EV175_006853, partial [Coemansia sp. RSA 1933]